VPQPTPEIFSGGDCGACVLGGLFGLAVEDVYVQLCDGKVRPISHLQMRSALHEAERRGYADRIVVEPARWPRSAEGYFDDFGYLASKDCINWWTHLRLAFDAGYYAIAEVDSNRGGPVASTDHWVMLAGVRQRWPADGSSDSTIHQDVLVSCSSRKTPDEEWVDSGEFLQKRGGFNALLARPCG
jgi:hypothetical protein